MKDQLEQWEAAAERRHEEQTEGVPKGHYRCFCGRVVQDSDAHYLDQNPYCSSSCGQCLDEYLRKNGLNKYL